MQPGPQSAPASSRRFFRRPSEPQPSGSRQDYAQGSLPRNNHAPPYGQPAQRHNSSYDHSHALQSRSPPPLPSSSYMPQQQPAYYNTQVAASSRPLPEPRRALPPGWTSYATTDDAYAEDAYRAGPSPPQQQSSQFPARQGTISPVRPRELSSGSMRLTTDFSQDESDRPVSYTPSNIISLYATNDTDTPPSQNASYQNPLASVERSEYSQYQQPYAGPQRAEGAGQADDVTSHRAPTIGSASQQGVRPLPHVPAPPSQPHLPERRNVADPYDGRRHASTQRDQREKPPLPVVPPRPAVQATGIVASQSTLPRQRQVTRPASPSVPISPSATSGLGSDWDAAQFYLPLPENARGADAHPSSGANPQPADASRMMSGSSARARSSSHNPQTPPRQKINTSVAQNSNSQTRSAVLPPSGGTSSTLYDSSPATSSAQHLDPYVIPMRPHERASPDGMASVMARRRERGSPNSLRHASSINRSRSIIGDKLVSPNRATGEEPHHVEMPSLVSERRLRNFSNDTFANVRAAREPFDDRQFDDSADTSFTGLLSPMPTAHALIAAKEYTLPALQEERNYSMLSFVATLLRDAVPRGTHIKGSVSYPSSFTGKDVVSTLQALVPRETLSWAAGRSDGLISASAERDIVLQVAKSIKSQLFFYEVDWGLGDLEDGVDDVYMFLDDGSKAAHDFDAIDRELYKAGKSAVPTQEAEEIPTGVFTALTACYSPLCGKPGMPIGVACYSSGCPRSQGTLSAPRLSTILAPGAAPPLPGASHDAIAWASTVPQSLLETLPKAEVKRQNAILELIQKDEEFLHDLELLDTLFLADLGKPAADGLPVMEQSELYQFVAEVFSNHTELIGHIRSLVERLHVRQREEGPVIAHVGDIYLHAALEWSGAFEANMTSFPVARHRLMREASVNARIHDFLERCRQDPRSHRLPMDHFLQRATTRLPRYNLHFKAILQDTDHASGDRESLSRAIELVDEQCKSIQKGVAAAEVKVKIREYAYNLATKRNRLGVHMDLLNPERQLVHQGRVFRKPDFTALEWQDLLCMLFDNYLVITKTKKREEGEHIISRFVVEKRPIAVEMLQLTGFQDPPVSRTMGLSNFHIRSDRENRDLFPFTLTHLGGKIEPLTLFVSSKEARDEWFGKLQEAIGLRAAMQEANKVFGNVPVFSDRFAIPAVGSIDTEKAPAGVDPTDFHGFVTCVYPFRMGDGRQLIAVGCADGVWIGLRNDARSLKQVLYLTLVTQVAVLEHFGILVVLSNRVLYAYSLDRLVPNANTPSNPRRGQKISEKRDVAFFSVGTIKDRTLLIYMKRKPNESVFHALEPIANHLRDAQDRTTPSGGGGLLSRFNRDSKTSEWFRVYKTFFIPSESYAMQFLRSKLCIICARGFEIIDLDTMMPGTIPDFSQSSREDPRIYNLHRRVESSRALAIFKTQDGDFLLCFDSFACFVDRRGNPIRLDHFIEWEGTPHSVSFREPFLLAFDSRFIEVRDSVSGQLVQLIRTNDLRNVTISSSSVSDDEEPIFLAQRTPGPTPTSSTTLRRLHDYQQVFELMGTMTYNQLKGPMHAMSLSSPGASTPTSFMHGQHNGMMSPTLSASHLMRQGTNTSMQTYTSNGSAGMPPAQARAGWI